MLHALADLGVKLAIDDFGTGYSSLSYLRQFPIDTLKIDQSFVNQMTSNPDDATIVSTVISMGKSLKQRVIAEGVETPEQYAFLLAQHCDEGQGFYFCRPMVAEALTSFTANRRITHPAPLTNLTLSREDYYSRKAAKYAKWLLIFLIERFSLCVPCVLARV